jgi:hypothetical protein
LITLASPTSPVLLFSRTSVSRSRPARWLESSVPTGCGKSTVVSLIPRFYDPTAGTVKIDGANIREFKKNPLRDQIGYVLQEPGLFAGTVRDNIAYGRPGVTEEQIKEAAKLANADEFIAKMPHGFDTILMIVHTSKCECVQCCITYTLSPRPFDGVSYWRGKSVHLGTAVHDVEHEWSVRVQAGEES